MLFLQRVIRYLRVLPTQLPKAFVEADIKQTLKGLNEKGTIDKQTADTLYRGFQNQKGIFKDGTMDAGLYADFAARLLALETRQGGDDTNYDNQNR